ncbi:g10859 [Coccomyxa viridis]|uniref:G10859 protein n=1 Tax=Coccomyxa viridis TaxID=1274662 RepID=A0ABP1GAN6_9CHLO
MASTAAARCACGGCAVNVDVAKLSMHKTTSVITTPPKVQSLMASESMPFQFASRRFSEDSLRSGFLTISRASGGCVAWHVMASDTWCMP